MNTSEVLLEGQVRYTLTTWPGPSPPIVALHGLGHVGAAWAGFANAMAGRVEIVAADLRGHGRSDIDGSGAYHLQTLVTDVVSLLAAVAPAGAVLVGHSLGGRIAVEIAMKDLAPLRAAFVVDNSPLPPPATLRHFAALYSRPPERFASPADYARRLAALHPLARVEDLEPLVAALDAAPGGGRRETVDPLALRAWTDGRLRDPWPTVREARTPLVLVRGAASSMLTRAVAAELLTSGIIDQVVEIPRAGHDVLLDNPTALAAAVVSCVEALGSSR